MRRLSVTQINAEDSPMKAVLFVCMIFVSMPAWAQRARDDQPSAERATETPRSARPRGDQPGEAPRTETPASEARPGSARTRNPETPGPNLQGFAVTPTAEKVDEKPIVTKHKITI